MRSRHYPGYRKRQAYRSDASVWMAADCVGAAVSDARRSPTRTYVCAAGKAVTNLKLKRTPGIFLIGFMGSGKSTVGRLLAEEIGWRFADLDDDIEHSQRRSVSDIFLQLGEEEF